MIQQALAAGSPAAEAAARKAPSVVRVSFSFLKCCSCTIPQHANPRCGVDLRLKGLDFQGGISLTL